MTELLDYAMRLHIFPFSLLLVLLVLFWLSVILGAADVSLFDFDLDVDADVDVSAEPGDHNFFRGVAEFFNLGEVPFMVLFSFFIVFTWTSLMVIDSTINTADYAMISWGVLLPTMIISALIAKYCSAPFGKVFNYMNNNPEDQDKAVGSKAILLQNTDEDHGRASIDTHSAPIEILCYTDAEILNKGDEVLVLSWNENRRKYLVTKY